MLRIPCPARATKQKKGFVKHDRNIVNEPHERRTYEKRLSLLKVSSLWVCRFPEGSWAGKREELYRKKHGEDTWPYCTSGFLPVCRLRVRWTDFISLKKKNRMLSNQSRWLSTDWDELGIKENFQHSWKPLKKKKNKENRLQGDFFYFLSWPRILGPCWDKTSHPDWNKYCFE